VHKPQPDVAARYAAYVLESVRTPLRDVFEARELLEGAAIELLGGEPPVEGLELLREINARGEAASGDLRASLDVHHEFHRALVDLGENLTVSLLRNMIDLTLEAAAERHIAAAGSAHELVSSRRAQRTHVRLVELIEAGAAMEAGHLWRSHLSDTAQLVLSSPDAALHVSL
jgi:DNA-binding GntR family transcriptional regulator